MDIQEITQQVEKQGVVVRQIMAEVEKIIVGQRDLLDRMLIGLLCDGILRDQERPYFPQYHSGG